MVKTELARGPPKLGRNQKSSWILSNYGVVGSAIFISCGDKLLSREEYCLSPAYGNNVLLDRLDSLYSLLKQNMKYYLS